MKQRWEAVERWLDERVPLGPVREAVLHKTVPVHRYSVFYYLGGMTLFFFVVQVVTGILLMLYYRPAPDGAFESVEFLMTTVPFGWLLRSIHSWSANLMIFFAFVHLASVYFMKAYRRPRELTWISGCVALFLALGFGFSGYLLPWNQLSFFATRVGTDIAGVVPGIGPWILRFLRGGDRITGGTLSRFYGWHVAILPAIMTLFLGLHVLLVQTLGMSVPPTVEEAASARRPMRFFPNFALRELMAWYVALAVLGALAALFPWNLGVKADPFASAPAGIKPEWYFLFMFQTLRLIPSKIFGIEGELFGIVGFGVLAAGALLVPFLDREKPFNTRRWITVAGVLVLVYMVAMTIYGHFAG
jgi:quinol-cytochrome oxidoreductase complex cytochrome b subunit